MNTDRLQQGKLHTIVGAGQVGMLLAHELLGKGQRVRLVRRGEAGSARAGLTWMRGDITDATFAAEACLGADVVINCTSPSAYHRWQELIPPLAKAVLMAAARAQARLVVLDNLYMYGMPQSAPFDEQTPHQPCSRKGELKSRLHRELFEAHARGDVRVSSGHASDFFGPRAERVSVFMPRLFRRLHAGKAVEMLGDAEMPHSYSYMPDVARGLAALAMNESANGHSWHLPVAHQGSTDELIGHFARAFEVEPRIRRVPNWVVRTGGLFVPLLRAVSEMVYQWEAPFVVDDRRFRATFGVEATPIDVAVMKTVRDFVVRDESRAAA